MWNKFGNFVWYTSSMFFSFMLRFTLSRCVNSREKQSLNQESKNEGWVDTDKGQAFESKTIEIEEYSNEVKDWHKIF